MKLLAIIGFAFVSPQLTFAETTTSPIELADRAGRFILDDKFTIPPDRSNRFWGNAEAIKLGEALFFDARLSADETVACASCHVTDGNFVPNETIPAQDDRKFRAVMPIAGASIQDFFFWDGRADSLWAQALGPLENPTEHGLTRTEVVQIALQNYRSEFIDLNIIEADFEFESVGAASPIGSRTQRENWRNLSNETQEQVNRVFSDIGKIIASFETTIVPPTTEFDEVALLAQTDPSALYLISASALNGLDLFSGRARCSTCHAGPLFTDADFHNTGMPQRDGVPIDMGRQAVIRQIERQEFGCLGEYSDAGEDDCPHVTYMNLSMERAMGAFRTPSLRQVSERTTFGHAGQFNSLRDIVRHYNEAPASVHGNLTGQGNTSELIPLGLTEDEISDIVAFLELL